MIVKYDNPQFDPSEYNFHNDPILIIDNFFTSADRATVIKRMRKADWHDSSAYPNLEQELPGQRWRRAVVPQEEHSIVAPMLFQWSCITNYLDDVQCFTDLSYYQYKEGCKLPRHNDNLTYGLDYYRQNGKILQQTRQRMIAVIGYIHNRWEEKWGGELVMYGKEELVITPEPGRLVLFTVPYDHEIKVVKDAELARLSIAGWIMKEKMHLITTYQ